jgi:hypothetical protein
MKNKSYQKEYKTPDLSPETPFEANKKALEFNIVDFWKWNQSDLVENRNRGILAEFIVKMALEIDSPTRLEWDAYDFEIPTEKGKIKIEVKSAAYLQAWAQKELSKISFSIAPSKALLEDGNYAEVRKRQADVYIFCLLIEEDQDKINPLNMDQWCFYIAPTSVLDKKLGDQKTLALSRFEDLGLEEIRYEELRSNFWTIIKG